MTEPLLERTAVERLRAWAETMAPAFPETRALAIEAASELERLQALVGRLEGALRKQGDKAEHGSMMCCIAEANEENMVAIGNHFVELANDARQALLVEGAREP